MLLSLDRKASIDLGNLLEDCVLVKQALTLNQAYYNDVLKKKGKLV